MKIECLNIALSDEVKIACLFSCLHLHESIWAMNIKFILHTHLFAADLMKKSFVSSVKK